MERLKVVCRTITSLGSSSEGNSTADCGRANGRLGSPNGNYSDSNRTNTGRGEDDGKSQGLEGGEQEGRVEDDAWFKDEADDRTDPSAKVERETDTTPVFRDSQSPHTCVTRLGPYTFFFPFRCHFN